MAEQRNCVMVPTIVFNGREGPHFTSAHNDLLMVEIKVASAIVRRILIYTRSSVDIITWDYLKKLKHPGREIIPLVHPILGFWRQEVDPTGGHSALIAQVIPVRPSLVTIHYLPDAGLKVAFQLKVIGRQGFHELAEEFCMVFMAAVIPLLLGLSRPISPRNLAGRSASRKSITHACVFIKASPMGSWAACWLPREPLEEGDLSTSLEAERSLDPCCGDGPSVLLPLEGGGSDLMGVR
ncbi:hypothetical protein Cgig2_011549 [Carnegiea gigantea]|uniref:Uncharacterized protein n=1 Tax=Carnegiea gigantea TaxID=171969 RepID=A0A9Q1GY93_9CARY|nr:hypothetical protein Cgig2_011549 [Carnegiea gigantea]